MTVMVDELHRWPTTISCFRAGSSHLTTDADLHELHAFAERLGLRREWFQPHVIAPHYDLTTPKRDLALKLGAKFVPMREQVRERRRLRSVEA